MTSLLHVGSIAALNAPEFEAPYPAPDIYFEGPEKKLEVFFSGLPNKSGFRHFPPYGGCCVSRAEYYSTYV